MICLYSTSACVGDISVTELKATRCWSQLNRFKTHYGAFELDPDFVFQPVLSSSSSTHHTAQYHNHRAPHENTAHNMTEAQSVGMCAKPPVAHQQCTVDSIQDSAGQPWPFKGAVWHFLRILRKRCMEFTVTSQSRKNRSPFYRQWMLQAKKLLHHWPSVSHWLLNMARSVVRGAATGGRYLPMRAEAPW